MSQGRHGYDCRLYAAALGTVAPVADPPGGAWAEIAEIRSMNGVPLTPSTTILTHLQSPDKAVEKMAGNTDPGQIQFQVNYFKANLAALVALFPAGVAGGQSVSNLKFLVRFSDSAFWYMEGFLAGFPFTVPEDGPITCDVTIELSGLPTFIAI